MDKKNKWIRASTDMPKRDMDVLFILDGKREIGHLAADNYWRIQNRYYAAEPMEKVIWWQTLPELPKKEITNE